MLRLHHRLLSVLLLLVAAANESATAFTHPASTQKIHPSQHHRHITTLSARKKKTDNEESESSNSASRSSAVNPAKKAALDGVLQRIERNYGRGSIVKLGDADRMIVDVISTGSMTLGECMHHVVWWNIFMWFE